MGFRSTIQSLTNRSETVEGDVDPRHEMPAEIVELIQRKQRAMGDKIPKPGTPEEVIAQRFDEQIKTAWENHNGQVK